MKKTIAAAFLTALLCLGAASPAYAAEVSASEAKPYALFEAEVESYRWTITNEIADQYETEAETALLAVDLDDTACEEFCEVVRRLHKLYKDNNCITREDLDEYRVESVNIVNEVAHKYGMHVSVDPVSKYATVTVTLGETNSKTAKAGATTVVADTSKVVKQTGFDVSQSVVVAVVLASVLAGTYLASKRLGLFN